MGLVSTTVGVLCDWNIESAGLFLRGNRKLLTKSGLISRRRKRRVRDTAGEFVGLGRLQRDLDKHDLWRVDTLPFPGIRESSTKMAQGLMSAMPYDYRG